MLQKSPSGIYYDNSFWVDDGKTKEDKIRSAFGAGVTITGNINISFETESQIKFSFIQDNKKYGGIYNKNLNYSNIYETS